MAFIPRAYHLSPPCRYIIYGNALRCRRAVRRACFNRLPYSRFPIDYSNECPAAILIPHLSSLKKCSRVLQLRALANLEMGQSAKALEDVKLSLYLINSIYKEPSLISHLVRVAMWQIILQPVYEGLAKHQWSDEQMVALDAELAKLDFLANYNFAMRGERGFNNGTIEWLRHQRKGMSIFGNFSEIAEIGVTKTEAIAFFFGPSGWYDQSKLRICQAYERSLFRIMDEKNRTVSPAVVRSADTAFQAETKHWNPCSILERLFLPALGTCAEKFAHTQTSVDLARTAVALERYRLAHAEFPESLVPLAPQFIAQVPHDVIGGQPLKYRRTADGQFILYSIGWNETDDGGTVKLRESVSGTVDISQGDWVWRYPQKK